MRLYCRKHPTYQARYYPASRCPECRALFNLRYGEIWEQREYPDEEYNLRASGLLKIGRRPEKGVK